MTLIHETSPMTETTAKKTYLDSAVVISVKLGPVLGLVQRLDLERVC